MLGKNPLRHSHYFAQRIKNVVKLLLCSAMHARRMRILDCGCGFGTESLIFALLGGKVLGVDLNVERLDIAKKRINYYKKLHP
jgi:2-polyprenyl-3-methyl-5-hydroxy-6-metoxy-1,4-benzoquinol methylase